MPSVPSVLSAAAAAAFLGVVSTLGDLVWALWIPRHRPVYGLIHGAVICLCIGLAVGLRHGAPHTGGTLGVLIGLTVAGGFYLLWPLAGWSAMFLMWMLFWVLFGALEGRLRGDGRWVPGMLRGLVAAVLSGAAFYAISGIWLRPSPDGPNYAWHLAAWTFAFFPGFAALFLGARRPRS